MKVGHQPVDHLELEAGMDEEHRKGASGRDGASTADRGIFERAGGRGAYGDHAAAFLSRGIDRGRSRVADLVRFRIDDVLFDALDAHGLERAVADVERDGRALDPARSQVVEHLRREVESRRRRRDRAAVGGEDGLVPIAVGRLIGTLDVGRQRNVPERIDERVDAGRGIFGPQPDAAASEEPLLEHLGDQRAGLAGEPDDRAGLEFLAGMHQRIALDRFTRGRRRQRQQQALDGAATRDSMAGQPRRKDAGVVHDQEIVRSEVLPQLCHASMLDRTGPTVEDEKARHSARCGLLCNQILGQVEIEIRDEHPVTLPRSRVGRARAYDRRVTERRGTHATSTGASTSAFPRKAERAEPAESRRHPGNDTPERQATTSIDEIMSTTAVRSLALTVIAVIGSILVLQYARPVLIPIVIGVLISYVLGPAVESLARHGVPRWAGAFLVIALLCGTLGFGGYKLAPQTLAIVEEMPTAARRLLDRTKISRPSEDDSALEKMQ